MNRAEAHMRTNWHSCALECRWLYVVYERQSVGDMAANPNISVFNPGRLSFGASRKELAGNTSGKMKYNLCCLRSSCYQVAPVVPQLLQDMRQPEL
eukprot:6486523-Amphidinium_carterae.1